MFLIKALIFVVLLETVEVDAALVTVYYPKD